jgi:hypothetical protein
LRFVRAFGAAALLLIAANVFAAKSDVVVLQNGDRITGEVKELKRGQLRLDTEEAGTICVEWDKIAAVTTAGRYQVGHARLRVLRRYLAPDTSGRFQVIAEDGPSRGSPISKPCPPGPSNPDSPSVTVL